MLKTDVEEEARIAHMYTDEDLASRITRKAAAWSVTLGPDNLEIVRDSEQITMIRSVSTSSTGMFASLITI